MSSAAARRTSARLLACSLLCMLAVGCHRKRPTPSPAGPASTAPLLPRIPRDAARFEIDAVDDSTATFRVFEARWLRPGISAYAVDPTQRDALVARLTIMRRDGSTATALVTSQVTRVTAEHFLLVPRPPTVWWRTREFWLSAAAGGIVGAGLTAVVR